MKIDTDPEQDVHARMRLFKTENVWNYLLLDTATGRVWQVQTSVNDDDARTMFPINTIGLAPAAHEEPGTFTIYATRNMYTFLLLNQITGEVWQLQWSTDDNRGIWRVPTPWFDREVRVGGEPKRSEPTARPDAPPPPQEPRAIPKSAKPRR